MVLMTTFSRTMALSISAFCAAVGLREVERSSSFFFFPCRRPAWAGRVVATKSARARPAIDCFPRIMYGSCGRPAGQPEYGLDASACGDNRIKIMFLIQRVEARR